MANNFTLFSEQIENLSVAEREWVEKELQEFEVVGLPDSFQEGEFVPDTVRKFSTGEMWTTDFWPEFEYKIETDEESGKVNLWLYSEESGNVENLAMFVQTFLEKFRPEETFALTWAETCSKPIVGEFGGGWMVVTSEERKFGNVWEQADEYCRSMGV